jgi:hypothetical protein
VHGEVTGPNTPAAKPAREPTPQALDGRCTPRRHRRRLSLTAPLGDIHHSRQKSTSCRFAHSPSTIAMGSMWKAASQMAGQLSAGRHEGRGTTEWCGEGSSRRITCAGRAHPSLRLNHIIPIHRGDSHSHLSGTETTSLA